MRNATAGIIIFCVIIMLGSIIWFEAFHMSKNNQYNEINSSGYQMIEKKYQNKIVHISGSAQRKSIEGSDWNALDVEDDVSNDDEIRTMGNSRLIISFENGIILRLDHTTQVKFNIDSQRIELELGAGRISVKSNMYGAMYKLNLGKYNIVESSGAFSAERVGDVYRVVVMGEEVRVLNSSEEVVEYMISGERLKIENDKLEKKLITNLDLNDFIYWSFGKNRSREVIEKLNADKINEESVIDDIENNNEQ
ncbi:FecR domain-containing protein [Patescibacteria group bacterium]